MSLTRNPFHVWLPLSFKRKRRVFCSDSCLASYGSLQRDLNDLGLIQDLSNSVNERWLPVMTGPSYAGEILTPVPTLAPVSHLKSSHMTCPT